MSHKVVARFRNGRVIKGVSVDAGSGSATFHVRRTDGSVARIRLEDLKALFFVRSLEGNPKRHENRIADPHDPRGHSSLVVTVVFMDGEVMTGMMNRNRAVDAYFFLTPVDPESNNIRVLVNRAAVAVVEEVQLT
jgi:hypothetical protein